MSQAIALPSEGAEDKIRLLRNASGDHILVEVYTGHSYDGGVYISTRKLLLAVAQLATEDK